ncbi:MAG: VWA domain-containing protein [Campylobacterota bacterium]|nr:VWA domain-containing protein [Campylobacterota bacterium]
MFDMFHFLRVEYLTLLLPIWLLVFWLLKRQDDKRVYKELIDEELLPYLLEEKKNKNLKTPILLGIVISLMVLALSGPAYKLSPSAGKQAQSEIVFVLNVSESMQSKDLSPYRFLRAGLKVDDFLKNNSDMKTALVAYNGSAHLVMPLIQDRTIISRFTSSLTPEIMPRKGDALYDAVKLASKQFVELSGSIVVVSDRLSKAEVKKIKEDSSLSRYKIIFYNITSEALQKQDVEKLATEMGADFISFSVNDKDIDTLQSSITQHYENVGMQKEGNYVDSGYELIVFIVFLLLLFFRKGFLTELWSVR